MTYTVTRHRETPFGEQWGISAITSRGTIAAGSVTKHGDSYDVRTDAGAKCFRGTDAYEVRIAAVAAYDAEQSS